MEKDLLECCDDATLHRLTIYGENERVLYFKGGSPFPDDGSHWVELLSYDENGVVLNKVRLTYDLKYLLQEYKQIKVPKIVYIPMYANLLNDEEEKNVEFYNKLGNFCEEYNSKVKPLC